MSSRPQLGGWGWLDTCPDGELGSLALFKTLTAKQTGPAAYLRSPMASCDVVFHEEFGDGCSDFGTCEALSAGVDAMRLERGAADGTVGSFHDFVVAAEPRVRRALVMVGGAEAAREATADALVEVWRRWDRVETMANREGYLYMVARRRLLRRRRPRSLPLPDEVAAELVVPQVEPRLVSALASLPERQRVAVYLMVGCEWTASEVAELTGVAATTVRTHRDRALARIREELSVTMEDEQ